MVTFFMIIRRIIYPKHNRNSIFHKPIYIIFFIAESKNFCRHTTDYRIRRYILSHNRTGQNHCPVTNCHTIDNRHGRTDPHIISYDDIMSGIIGIFEFIEHRPFIQPVTILFQCRHKIRRRRHIWICIWMNTRYRYTERTDRTKPSNLSGNRAVVCNI